MIVLSGAELVLPDRIVSPGTIVFEGGRITEVRSGSPHGSSPFAFHNHYIVPGFIDVHVHGVDGFDSLGDGDPIRSISERLPRHGVTAFCPTTVASAPAALARVLAQVRQLRTTRTARAARVLPLHIESNFTSAEFAGAQPVDCLRSPRAALDRLMNGDDGAESRSTVFTGDEILREIDRGAPDVGIVTIAPELDGGLELIAWLVARGIRTSLGHSGASYEEAAAAIAAGARQATHLFNRMRPVDHRAPGLAGAVLQSDEIAAEIICDGSHVHPAIIRTAVAAKRPARLLAISDGTAASGRPVGTRVRLGERTITARDAGAYLADGTLAGSVATMETVFRTLVERVGLSLVDASTMCSTTPARELGLVGHGVLAEDAVADVVVLDSRFTVVQTYIDGELAYSRNAHG